MKKLFSALMLALAVNFLVAAGGIAWLFKSGKLDKAKVAAIREMVFPKQEAAGSTTQPSGDGAAGERSALARLDTLLEQHSGRRAGEQVELIQQAFDAQSAQLDRKARELELLQRQVAEQQERIAAAALALERDRAALRTREQQSNALAGDKGFQDSLKLYSSMPGKQAKQVFMSLPDETVVAYLQAMPPRTATKIVREFKAPEEAERINRIMERMRQAGQGAQPATRPAGPLADTAAPGT